MLSLLLDTATERGLVALCEDDRVLFEIHLPFGLQNSKVLFYELDRLFKETKLERSDLKLIICGQGPGSYTGLRVAAASAQSLSFALQIPLVGVPTTAGFVSETDGCFAAIIDAKISGVYMQKACKSNNEIHYISSPEIVSIEQLSEKLYDVTTIVTPKKESLMQKMQGDWIWEEKGLSAQSMLVSALKKFNLNEFSDKSRLDLLYLRKTQAELERLNSGCS